MSEHADPEPQPGDGPEYHEDHAAWVRRQAGPRPEPQMSEHADRMSRATALSPPEMLRLDQWAEALTWTFPDGLYLVGSVLTRDDPRDVDVRCRITDDDPMLADPDRLRVVNVALSVWAQQATGLAVDFQFQSISEFAMHGEAGKLRNPIGHRWRTVHADESGAFPRGAPDE